MFGDWDWKGCELTTGQEIKSHNVISGCVAERLAAEGNANQLGAVSASRVPGDVEVLGDLDLGGDDLLVVLVESRVDTLEGLPELLAGDFDLDNGVAEGEGSENLTAGDWAGINGGADTTTVDDSAIGCGGLVEAVFEHGVSHEVSEDTWWS